MSGYDEQKAAIRAATDALLAKVQAPSDVEQAGVDMIVFLYGEIDRIKTCFKDNDRKLRLGKGGRGGGKKSTVSPQPVAEAA